MYVQKRETANFKPQYMRMGGNTSRYKQQTTSTIMKVTKNIFPIYKVETNERIIALAEERNEIYCRVAIRPQGESDNLSEDEKALLAQLSDKQRTTTLNGQLTQEISNIFPVSIFSEYIDGLDAICKDKEYFGADAQQEIVDQLFELLAKEKFIFTYYTASVEELLRGTEYQSTKVLYREREDGTIKAIGTRNNLYFGFFNDAESALSFMSSRLVSDIDDGDLLTEKPTAENESEQQTAANDKPKIQLSRK